jgi:G3E family GTPase
VDRRHALCRGAFPRAAIDMPFRVTIFHSLTMIPTNIITGFLGVGKTTAILDLLNCRTSNERWGVLVNEFGDVAIDQVAFSDQRDDKLVLREVAGGCICCTAGISMQQAVRHLVKSADISRLIIEPTGLGHPWRVLDGLRNAEFRKLLDLRATICLVDPRNHQKMAANVQTFCDQAHLADAIVVNKIDLADAASVTACVEWAESLFPAKSLVATTQDGRLQPEWLDMASDAKRSPLFAEAHDHHHHGKHHDHPSHDLHGILTQGKPQRFVNAANGHHACGWIFSADDVFDEDRLLETLFDRFDVVRLKGVFRIGDDWMLINRVGVETRMEPIAYRRDSRIEAIADGPRDWHECEKNLLSCLK